QARCRAAHRRRTAGDRDEELRSLARGARHGEEGDGVMITRGGIDCDVHPAVPSTTALLPYLDDYWRDQIVTRHIHKTSFHLQSYPPNSPLSCRPDWRVQAGPPGSDLDLLRAQALDAFGTRVAICNTLHGAISLFNEDMAAALIAAVNSYVAKEWLDREPRLRASILLPLHNPEL